MNTYSAAALASTESRDDLITNNVGLVKRIAYYLSAQLPNSVEIDDLIQAGMVGLLEAASHYDSSHGASFDTYAGIRIRGAILDEVRRKDWTPRSVYRKQREVSEMVRSIESETGKPAEATDVADGLGISVDEYHAILSDGAGCKLFSLDSALEDSEPTRVQPKSATATPEQLVDEVQQRQAIVAAVEKLTEREQLILSLYYEKELNLKEIGEVLGVSESRVCQIHSQAAMRIRSMLKE